MHNEKEIQPKMPHVEEIYVANTVVHEQKHGRFHYHVQSERNSDGASMGIKKSRVDSVVCRGNDGELFPKMNTRVPSETNIPPYS